jgi:hypothetical protein
MKYLYLGEVVLEVSLLLSYSRNVLFFLPSSISDFRISQTLGWLFPFELASLNTLPSVPLENFVVLAHNIKY